MRRLALLLVSFFLSGTGQALDAPVYGPVPEWVVPVEAPATDSLPDDGAVKILLQDQQFDFGKAIDEMYFGSVVRIQTAQGLGGMGTITLAWKPDTDALTIHRLNIVRGDQVIDTLDEGRAVTVLRREDNLEWSALDGVLTAVVQPEGMEVGDIIDLAYSIHRTKQELPGTTEQVAGSGGELPISRLHVRARWPKSSGIRWKASAAMDSVKETRSGAYTVVSYDGRNLEALLQPIGAPGRFQVNREIQFTGFKSWKDASKALAPAYESAATLSGDSPIHTEIDRIRASSPDPVARAEAALTLVQDKIRYVFLGMNEGGLVPAGSDETWMRRFGDCKAKTALLLALLHGLDIDAEPVAVATVSGDGLDERLPMIAWFDHVLVRARIDGRTYWLDGTRAGDRHLENLRTPNYAWELPLLAQGSDLARLLVTPLDEPMSVTAVHIDASAGIGLAAPFRVEATLSGDTATLLRLQFANLGKAELDRGLRALWSNQYHFVDIETVAVEIDEETDDVRLTMSGLARMGWNDGWYEAAGLRLGHMADFMRPDGADKTAPFAVPFPLYSVARETILLPKESGKFTVRGENIDKVVAGVEYRRKATLEAGVFTAEASTRSLRSEFPAEEAEQAQRTLREMAKSGLYLRAPYRYVATDQELAAERDKTPDTANAYIRRGNMLLDHHEFEAAIADFDKAIALDSKSDLAFADRGLAYLGLDELDLARADLDAASAINPRNPVVFRARGVLASMEGFFTDAITAFSRSLELEPQNLFALRGRAHAYAQIRDTENAAIDAAEVIRILPQEIDMYGLRASLFARDGELEKAGVEVRALLSANPDSVPAHDAAASLYSMLMMTDEAVAAMDRLIEIEPNEQAYLKRASLRPKSDIPGRRADIDAALALNERSANALAMKARLQIAAEEYADAAATSSVAMSIDADDPDPVTVRAIAYAKGGQDGLAQADFATARSLSRSAESLNDMCWTIAISGVALEQALSACEAAVEKAPTYAAALDSHGFVLLRLARYEEAIATYDAALDIEKNLAESLYGRGIAKRRLGLAAEGDADIRAALAADRRVAQQFTDYQVTP